MQARQTDPLTQVWDYHQRSKHHLNGYARSLGYLDWSNQPDPFRRFTGAPRLPLLHPAVADEPYYDSLFAGDSNRASTLDDEAISRLFYDSLALSAWKQMAGSDPWSLRVNPSSGDLHPTEGYLIAGAIKGLSTEPGVYHYSSFEHALEQRLTLPVQEWQALARQLPEGSVLLGLSSIYWRESWKYGERAFRYCHHDVGHALGAITLAAAALGWRTRLIGAVGDDELSLLLGVHQQIGMEAEHPDCLLAIFPARHGSAPDAIELSLAPQWLSRLAKAGWLGKENPLSHDHHHWPVIDEIAAAVHYAGQPLELKFSQPAAPVNIGSAAEILSERRISARRIIRQRRSAVAMDGRTEIDREVFYRMLARVSPRLSPAVFAVLPWRPRISLALFVHRVRDLAPGLYLLVRDFSQRDSLRAALRREFIWEKPAGCPGDLELYLLHAGDTRETAQIISCHQEIAAEGVFSLGMLAEFELSLSQRGPWFYPRLFWEAGLIGQLLYLEAEAAGVRATGIGCFFDDAMHRLLGIADRSWQSLYHFTVGGPVEDPRLRTLDPYFYLTAGTG